MNILAFSFNTDNINLCDGTYNWFNKCHEAKFVDKIDQQIKLYHPEIVIINTEANNGDKFHSVYLQQYFVWLGYRLLTRHSYDNLRISLYINNPKIELLNFNDQVNSTIYFQGDNYLRSVALFINTTYGSIAVIGIQTDHKFKPDQKYINSLLNRHLAIDIDYVFLMGDFN